VASGYDVVISNSRGPETLSALIAELGPRARAATAAEAAKAGDMVVVSVPLKSYRNVPVAPLAGKIVIDTNNYYPARDGHIPELDNESTTTSELLQAHLPTSKVVKAFTTVRATSSILEVSAMGRRTVHVSVNKALGDGFSKLLKTLRQRAQGKVRERDAGQDIYFGRRNRCMIAELIPDCLT